MTETESCLCPELADPAIISMGDDERLDERIFETLDCLLDYGGDKWWLSISKCKRCEQLWMVAHEEWIHDNYCLRRINSKVFQDITEQSKWPDEFLLYENVLRLGVESGRVAMFLDPQDFALVTAAKELRAARPEISLQEIAYALNITARQAGKLLRK